MNTFIEPSAEELTDLLPEKLRKGAAKIFRDQSLHAVLLRLLPDHHKDEQSSCPNDTAELLHPRERAVFNSYRLAKRRTEFLTGRVCAKKAVQNLLVHVEGHREPPPAATIEIARTSSGRPFALLHGAQGDVPEIDISITHSGDFGAAVAANAKCGIDLQLQKSTLGQVLEKFCTQTERGILESSIAHCEELPRLALLWAAKEAGKKALGFWQMPGFLDLHLTAITRCYDYFTASLKIARMAPLRLPEQITVFAALVDDYALAICLVNEENGDA